MAETPTARGGDPGRSSTQTDDATSITADTDKTTLTTWARRWRALRLGCPRGCPPNYHEHDELVHERCNYCTSLDGPAREAMHDCSKVCPLGRGQVT